jgi:hypothetical protein
MVRVNVLAEGSTDEPVAKRLLKHSGLEVGIVYGRNGKPDLLKRLPNYNKAAQFTPWFIIVDLDTDHQCAVHALKKWLPEPSRGMRFRIAVRAIEAWLLADKENMAQFLGVSLSKLQHNFDLEPDPKETLVDIARRSRSRSIREDIVPRPVSGAKVGPLYVPQLTRFVNELWRPDLASAESESLRRCLQALSTLADWES